MKINRRNFLKGMAGILAAGVAPAAVSSPMKIWVPPKNKIITGDFYCTQACFFGEVTKVMFDYATGDGWCHATERTDKPTKMLLQFQFDHTVKQLPRVGHTVKINFNIKENGHGQ